MFMHTNVCTVNTLGYTLWPQFRSYFKVMSANIELYSVTCR
jgi:hypothetical protein